MFYLMRAISFKLDLLFFCESIAKHSEALVYPQTQEPRLCVSVVLVATQEALSNILTIK